jgi:tetratricopeptide (TPR) repeat protein
MALLRWKMQSPPTLEAMERGALQAAQEDPWDPMPRQVLVQSIWQQIAAQAVQGSPVSPQRLEEYQQACQQWLASDPVSWQPRIDLGHQSLELAGLIPDGSFGLQALRHYQRAIERYPNEVAVHLQTALAAALLGDLELANASLRQAESLDTSTQHRDRRLKAALIYLPKSWDSFISSRMDAPFVRPNPGSPWVLGEPAAALIRSMLERFAAPSPASSQELQPATNS